MPDSAVLSSANIVQTWNTWAASSRVGCTPANQAVVRVAMSAFRPIFWICGGAAASAFRAAGTSGTRVSSGSWRLFSFQERAQGLLLGNRAERCPQQGSHGDGWLGGDGGGVISQVQEDRNVANLVPEAAGRALAQAGLAGRMPEKRGLAAARTSHDRQDRGLLAAMEVTEDAALSS